MSWIKERVLGWCANQRCRIVLLDPGARLPELGTTHAAGYDLSSIECVTLPPRGRGLVRTGLAVAIPKGFHLEIRPRSGLALHHGITVLNAPGTIDADYRGELKVILFNTTDVPYIIEHGERIAQALLMRQRTIAWDVVLSLDETTRGISGFGSTGMGGGP
ncbi:MAG: dUTP diphosphatase [Proteobacteria bacterium]|nr:dUTP diphosphatase [Pseudomonadota bacterium]